jgi:hypothetical protein
MSISFMPYVYDATRELWVYPDKVREDVDSYELNLSNANALDLLEAIGLPPESVGTVAIDSFSEMLAAAVRAHLDRRSPAIAPTTDHQPGRVTIHHCGRRGGYIESRLGDLARLVENARGDGATHIGWG